jgi:hypothetical protein
VVGASLQVSPHPLGAAASAELCNRAEADPGPVRLDASDPDCLEGRP